jgi:hypothetical protein
MVLITILLSYRAPRLFIQLITLVDKLSLFGVHPCLHSGVFQARCLDNVSYSLRSHFLHLLKML